MKYSILLVDDCRENLENFKELLELEGYNVLTTLNPIEAYTISTSMLPSLIISDIKMGGMSGFELIQLLRINKTTSHIPIIFHSSHSEPSIIKTGMVMGASDYIVKPSTFKVLNNSISQTLSK